jgi:predicted nucleic acid-binding protein
MAVLVDTSAIVALADADNPSHAAIYAFALHAAEPLLVPITVLPEADYLIATRFGGHIARAVLQSITDGAFRLEQVTLADIERSKDLMEEYADSTIGLVDASIIAVAERLRIERVLTLDHRHFRFVRPRHCTAFDVVP